MTGTKHDGYTTAVKVGPGHANGRFGAILKHTPAGRKLPVKRGTSPWQATMPALSLLIWHYGASAAGHAALSGRCLFDRGRR